MLFKRERKTVKKKKKVRWIAGGDKMQGCSVVWYFKKTAEN